MTLSTRDFMNLYRVADEADKKALAKKYPTQFNEMIKLNPTERARYQLNQAKEKLVNDYKDVQKNVQQKAKDVQKKAGEIKTTVQNKATEYSKAIQNKQQSTPKPSPKPTPKVLTTGTKALNMLGKTLAPIAGVGEIVTSKEPMGKVLGGVTALSPLAGPYAGVVAGSSLVGSGIVDNAKNIANKISDKMYQNWERQYGSNESGLPKNLENMDPMLKPLNISQQAGATLYDTKQTLDNYNKEVQDYQNALRQELGQEQEMVNLGQENVNSLGRQLDIAENNLKIMNGDYQLTPPPSQPQYQGRQNPYPGVVPMSSNNIPVQQELQGNRQMVDNNLPYNLSTQYRQGANAGLSGLFNSLQGIDSSTPEKDYTSSIDNYMNILNSAYAQQQQNQEQLQKQLQSARRYDALNNAINQFSYLQDRDNAARMRAFIPNGRGGYDLINLGGEGTLDKPERVSTAQQYEQAIADNSKTTQEYLQKLAELQQASDLADMYGGSPLAYINPDLAKEIVKGTYDVKGVTEKGVQERKTLPYKAGADIITKQAEQAGQLDIENLKGQYGLAQEDVKGRYDYSTEGLKQSNENQRAILQANLARELQGMKNEQILQVAKQYGANAMQLAQLKDQLEQNNPVARARAIGSLAAGVSAMPDPSMLGEITGSIPDYEAILFGNSSLGDNATQKQNDILNKYGL